VIIGLANPSQNNVFALGILKSENVDILFSSIITCAEPEDVLTSKICLCDEFKVFFKMF
jgi:hypothetical protein